MRKFIERALKKLPKLDEEQIRTLILDIASESDLFEIVLESMSDGLVVLDRRHTIIIHNKSAERLLPFRRMELNESIIWESLNDSEIALFFKETLFQGERAYDKQFTLDSGGALRILSCSIMPLVREEETLGNFPQAPTHLAVIITGLELTSAIKGKKEDKTHEEL